MTEQEPVEEDFKVVSKTAQSLVKDSPQEAINAMLNELKTVKDRLVVLRRELPERLKPFKSLLQHIESLETGIVDLEAWLSAGEELLASHRIDGNINVVEDRLESHTVRYDFLNNL